MKKALLTFVAILLSASTATAHHGVASLGVGGFEGPEAPIETSSSATPPEAGFLAYFKLG